ncbi:hypothetical protein L208DRAFT_1548935 [Tricholoma matsutake]|nr:hypothetical protein L208DRAFT_1548935 [Tricholoma matsutake 945]
MIELTEGSRQPLQEPWTMDHLIHERAIVLGLSIDESSNLTYTSALNSYITFCRLHHFPIEPTEETLSFFAVYTSTFIKPNSVNSYLSGVVNQLEPFFPDVRTHQNSNLVKHTMVGCCCCFGSPVKCKQLLSKSDLRVVIKKLGMLQSHDERLFLAILLTSFHGLMHLGELCFPDRITSRNYRKVSLCHTVSANGGIFPKDIGGQSMHAGGATSLTEAGAAPPVIQAIGRWASNSFQIYIQKNPILFQALLLLRITL